MLLAPNGLPLPRVLTTAQAWSLGFTPSQVRTELRAGRWEQLVRGVYLTRGELPDRLDWLRAGMLLGGRGAVLSGWDAVRTYGLGSERPPSENVLILSAGGAHRVAGRVRIRPSRRELRCGRAPTLGGVLVAGAARAVADTALEYRTLAPVRALVTSSVQLGRCTTDELWRELSTGPRNGSAHLRRAVADVLDGAASLPEAELAALLREAGMPTFELNVLILDAGGRHIATADVLWRSLRAALEVDSRRHHFLEPQWRGTMRRHNLLTSGGLVLTHYAPSELLNRPDAVLHEIDRWLRSRATELGAGYPPPSVPAKLRGTPFHLQ